MGSVIPLISFLFFYNKGRNTQIVFVFIKIKNIMMIKSQQYAFLLEGRIVDFFLKKKGERKMKEKVEKL